MFTSFKKSILFLALMAGVGINQNAWAQTEKTTWTLQECVDYALKNNLTIKQTALDAELATVNAKQSRTNLLPSFNASSSYGYNFGRSIDPTENTFTNQQIGISNYSLNASVPIFNGFQLQNTVKQNRLNLQAAGADVEKVRNDIILSIVNAYLQIIFGDELLQTARLQLNNSQQQADRTQKLFRAGSVAESNVFEINSQVATDELAIINAQNQLDLAKLNLIQLLDLKKVDRFELSKPDIKDPDEDVITFDAESVYDIAQERMPEVKSSDLRVASALKGIEISRGALYPRLAIGGSLSTQYSSSRPRYIDTKQTEVRTIGYLGGDLNQPVTTVFPSPLIVTNYPYLEQLSDNRGESVFLSLSIPIFNGFTARNNISRSIVNHKFAILNTEVVRNQLRKNIQQAYADALAAQKKFSATKRQLAALELTFRNAEIRFNNGSLNPTEYNVAKNNLVRSQSDLLQAKFDYTFRLKVLDFYQGKPLSL